MSEPRGSRNTNTNKLCPGCRTSTTSMQIATLAEQNSRQRRRCWRTRGGRKAMAVVICPQRLASWRLVNESNKWINQGDTPTTVSGASEGQIIMDSQRPPAYCPTSRWIKLLGDQTTRRRTMRRKDPHSFQKKSRSTSTCAFFQFAMGLIHEEPEPVMFRCDSFSSFY